ncbi:MAG: hypothetical protein AAF478_09765 [Pseudomonadota bacterium]
MIDSAKSLDNAGTLLDLATVEQLRGNTGSGMEFQRAALKQSRFFSSPICSSASLKLLVINAPLEIGCNTPVDFLLLNSNILTISYYMDVENPVPETLPQHDLIFVAAPGDDSRYNPYIQSIDHYVSANSFDVINAPDQIMKLDRDILPRVLGDIEGLVVPDIVRVNHEDLADRPQDVEVWRRAEKLMQQRFVIRPTASHAGKGLESLSAAAELPVYLSNNQASEYFVSEFVDYRSSDGQFRKYRIIFVDGKAYPYHLAIGSSWKLWYMNAEMGASKYKLSEEADFLKSFDDDFRARHMNALDALCGAIGLDYFGIDCAEDAAGNLVVFEADNALIVHDMDAVGKFSFKEEPCANLFVAFQEMLFRKAGKDVGSIPGEATSINTRDHNLPA